MSPAASLPGTLAGHLAVTNRAGVRALSSFLHLSLFFLSHYLFLSLSLSFSVSLALIVVGQRRCTKRMSLSLPTGPDDLGLMDLSLQYLEEFGSLLRDRASPLLLALVEVVFYVRAPNEMMTRSPAGFFGLLWDNVGVMLLILFRGAFCRGGSFRDHCILRHPFS